MSFKMVFRSLQEVFPQVDLRILKAVAIEHSKDVDAAVEFILSEVLPSLNEPTEPPCTVDNNTRGMRNSPAKGWEETFLGNQKSEKENKNLLPELSVSCESDPYINHSSASLLSSKFSKKTNLEEDEPNVLLHHQAGEEVLSNMLSEPTFVECGITVASDNTTGAFHVKSDLCSDKVTVSSNAYISDQLISNEEPVVVTSNPHVNTQIVFNGDFEEQTTSVDAVEKISRPLQTFETNSYGGLPDNFQGATMNVSACCIPAQNSLFSEKEAPTSVSDDTSNLECGDHSSLSNFNYQYLRGILDKSSEPVALETCMSMVAEIPTLEGSQSGSAVGMSILEDFISDVKSNKEAPTSVSEDTSNLECGDHSSLSNINYQHLRGIFEKSFEPVAVETYMSMVAEIPTLEGSQSGSAVGMSILQDFISDVKSNKETLLSSFESVKNMIKDVELHEDRVKQAKEEACKAGLEMLTKAEDMKEMLKHAKEAKETQTREVYGEKSKLATKARELQFLLLNLSDEKEKTLSIIEEMYQTLEARLAIAKEEWSAAEQEKFEKEEAASKILKEQEVIMEEIVEESKRLQQESEENAKLRDFLMDRGRIINILQEEIAVICEDVKLLKERVDGHVPPSKSLLLTSSSLASSSFSSSNAGSLPERILHAVDLGQAPEDPTRNNQLESNVGDGSNRAISDDDDWEFSELLD